LVSLGLDSAEFKSGLSNAEKEFRRSTKRMEAIGRGMANVGKSLTLAVTAPIVALGVTSIKAAIESNQAIKSVEATLASMGAQAGFTAKQLEEVASGIMRKSLYDDDEVLRQVTNTMLTFGKVTGQTFLRAQQAAVDLSAKFGKDLLSSTIMVGKALQDPVKGLTALSRAGISFSPAQAKVIKSLVATGQAAKAQKLILKELERQVTGSAQAMRDADPLAAMRLSFGEFQEEIGKKLLPLLPRVTDAITKVLDAFGKLSPGMQETVIIVAGLAAAFGPLLIVMGSVTSAIAPMVMGIKSIVAVSIAAGVQTGSLAVSLGVLRAAFVPLLAAVLPYVAALGALVAIYYLVKSRNFEAAKATETYAKAATAAAASSEQASQMAAGLATATGKVRAEALAAAKAMREKAKQDLAAAKAAAINAGAQLALAQAYNAKMKAGGQGFAERGLSSTLPGAGAAQAEAIAAADVAAGQRTIDSLTRTLRTLDQAINSNAPSAVSDIAAPDTETARTKKPKEDRTAEIQARFEEQLIANEIEALQIQESLVRGLDERVDIQRDILEKERTLRLAQIQNDEDYTTEQKAALTAQIEGLYGVAVQIDEQGNIIATGNRSLLAQQIEFERQLELERSAADLAQVAFDSQREQLSLAGDMADTQAERKRIALDILKLEQDYRRNQLEMIVASGTALDAEKARAQAILDSLGAIEAGERASVGRSNETELERFLRSYNKSPEQIGEERLGIGLDGIDKLVDGLSRIPATVDSVKDAFKAMRDVFQSVIQDMLAALIRLQIQKAIAGLIGSALGGAGGAPTNLLEGIPGYAGGTGFHPGGLAIVGEEGPEIAKFPRGTQIFSNNELQGMGGNQTVFNVNVSGAMSDRDARRTGHQIASAASQRMAQARRAGVAG
jgi:hypothetical protein